MFHFLFFSIFSFHSSCRNFSENCFIFERLPSPVRSDARIETDKEKKKTIKILKLCLTYDLCDYNHTNFFIFSCGMDVDVLLLTTLT